jgi:hypothetical protein
VAPLPLRRAAVWPRRRRLAAVHFPPRRLLPSPPGLSFASISAM